MRRDPASSHFAERGQPHRGVATLADQPILIMTRMQPGPLSHPARVVDAHTRALIDASLVQRAPTPTAEQTPDMATMEV